MSEQGEQGLTQQLLPENDQYGCVLLTDIKKETSHFSFGENLEEQETNISLLRQFPEIVTGIDHFLSQPANVEIWGCNLESDESEHGHMFISGKYQDSPSNNDWKPLDLFIKNTSCARSEQLGTDIARTLQLPSYKVVPCSFYEGLTLGVEDTLISNQLAGSNPDATYAIMERVFGPSIDTHLRRNAWQFCDQPIDRIAFSIGQTNMFDYLLANTSEAKDEHYLINEITEKITRIDHETGFRHHNGPTPNTFLLDRLLDKTLRRKPYPCELDAFWKGVQDTQLTAIRERAQLGQLFDQAITQQAHCYWGTLEERDKNSFFNRLDNFQLPEV
jgi:hypothetical protein